MAEAVECASLVPDEILYEVYKVIGANFLHEGMRTPWPAEYVTMIEKVRGGGGGNAVCVTDKFLYGKELKK